MIRWIIKRRVKIWQLKSLGKFFRKIRIDYGEILKNMADKLEVVFFLSAVENGKKKMPSNWYK